jgi:hypothetical protein
MLNDSNSCLFSILYYFAKTFNAFRSLLIYVVLCLRKNKWEPKRQASTPIHSCFWGATHQCSGIESTRSSVNFCSLLCYPRSLPLSSHCYELLHPPAARPGHIAGSAVAGIITLTSQARSSPLRIMTTRLRAVAYAASTPEAAVAAMRSAGARTQTFHARSQSSRAHAAVSSSSLPPHLLRARPSNRDR